MYRYCMDNVTTRMQTAELSLYFFDDVVVEVPMSGPGLLPAKGLRFWSSGKPLGKVVLEWQETDAREERKERAEQAAQDGTWRTLQAVVPQARCLPLDNVTSARATHVWWHWHRLVLDGDLPEGTGRYHFYDTDSPTAEVASALRDLLGDRFADHTGRRRRLRLFGRAGTG